MGLALIVGFYLLSLGWGSAQAQSGAAAAQSQAPSPQTEPAPAPKSEEVQAKPQRHHKKTVPPNCTSSPTPLNPAIGNPDPAKPTAGASIDDASHSPSSGQSDATDAAAKSSGLTSSGLTSSAPATSASTPLPPCPPARKVVRNGGSKEPAIQLIGGTNAEQAAHQRSTDELTSATEENLKKVAGRQLSESEEETVSQVKQFLQQSKTAVAAGDLERGQNLAQKAHLLSEELVKP